MPIAVDGITIAVTNIQQMLAFYNAVFDANLEPTVEIGDNQFYAGTLAGLKLTFCPNAIAGVIAEQNRQQFRFSVDDLESMMQKGQAHHGTVVNPIEVYKGAKVSSLADPDGNTIEFVQHLD